MFEAQAQLLRARLDALLSQHARDTLELSELRDLVAQQDATIQQLQQARADDAAALDLTGEEEAIADDVAAYVQRVDAGAVEVAQMRAAAAGQVADLEARLQRSTRAVLEASEMRRQSDVLEPTPTPPGLDVPRSFDRATL
jgi:hypothetical protein